MLYRVKKIIGEEKVHWVPQARPAWFPFFWFCFDHWSAETEREAWDRCKRHAEGPSKYCDTLDVAPKVITLIGLFVVTAPVFFALVLPKILELLNG